MILRSKSPLQWARHAFPYYPKCDMLLNNLCETFNLKIVEAREKPLVNILETIRRYLMVRIRNNKDSMAKYEGPICHKIQQKLEKFKEATIDYTSIWSSGTRWDVNSGGKQFVVDVEKRSCACNCWDLNGIPCKHAVHVIAFRKEQAEDYMHDFYKKDTYIALYSHLIQPRNGPDLWPEVDGDAILPLIHKIQLGRLKIDKERNDKDEVHNPYKMKRNQTSLRCAYCHH